MGYECKEVDQGSSSLVFISTRLSAQHSRKKGGVRQLLLRSTSECNQGAAGERIRGIPGPTNRLTTLFSTAKHTPDDADISGRLPHVSVAEAGGVSWLLDALFLSSLCRVLKKDLFELDLKCREFLSAIVNVPGNAITDFFYADRNAGGLGAPKLSVEADIWTLARASNYSAVRTPWYVQSRGGN